MERSGGLERVCGIVGIVAGRTNGALGPVSARGCEAAPERVARMVASLRHRGPDGHGTWCDDDVALGHARLSIIAPGPGGAQPMASADGRYVLSYNGELYNFRELRAELEAGGAAFRSASDSEVVLQAFARWGEDAFARFNGMFAVAIWDVRERRLTLARDRFGIKPLYHVGAGGDGGAFAFASEIGALRAGDALGDRLSRQGLIEYLYYGMALGTETLYAGCAKLAPGHVLTLGPGEAPRIRPFWTLASLPPTRAVPEAEAVEAVRALLGRAVDRHLVADVPVALFLSGGLDSSTLCVLAAERYADRLATWSVEFEGDGATSELATAREVAGRCGTEHHEVRLAYTDLESVLERITDAHGQPFGDAANVPLYLLTQGLGDTKVVLQGDGGDEIFAGYRRYGLMDRLPAWRLFRTLARLPHGLANRSNLARRVRRMQDALGAADGAERQARLLTEEWSDDEVLGLLNAELRAAVAGIDPFRRYRELWPAVASRPPAQAMLWTDTQVLLPDQFLEKVDRATMANSVEVRVPFLDTELADYVMALPAAMKVGAPSKRLLRLAMADALPRSVLHGPKLGFGVPYGAWLRGPLAGYARERLLDPEGLVARLFDVRAVEALWRLHVERGVDRGFMLYKLLMLSLWAERFGVRGL